MDAPFISERLGARVMLKLDGANPTGSFKDRGMAVSVAKALEAGAVGVVCASTGNTAASAAAYAARAGLPAIVLHPAGAIAPAKQAQARAAGARVLEVRGTTRTIDTNRRLDRGCWRSRFAPLHGDRPGERKMRRSG